VYVNLSVGGTYLLTVYKALSLFLSGRAFFMCLLNGWVMGLDCYKDFKMPPIHLEPHTVGYLIIALVYLIMAFK